MFKEFFQEDSKSSLVRLMSFISLCAGVIIALASLVTDIDVWLVSILLGFAFGGKVSQKVVEVKK